MEFTGSAASLKRICEIYLDSAGRNNRWCGEGPPAAKRQQRHECTRRDGEESSGGRLKARVGGRTLWCDGPDVDLAVPPTSPRKVKVKDVGQECPTHTGLLASWLKWVPHPSALLAKEWDFPRVGCGSRTRDQYPATARFHYCLQDSLTI